MAGNLFGMIEIQKAVNKYTFEQFLSLLLMILFSNYNFTFHSAHIFWQKL